MSRASLSFKAVLLLALLALSLAGCVAPNQGAKPSSGGGPLLTGMTAEEDDGQTRIVLEGSQPLTYSSQLLEEEPVIVVDVDAGASPNILGVTQLDNGTISRINVNSPPGLNKVTRVSLFLVHPSTYQVLQEDNRLIVVVENVAGDLGPEPSDLPPLEEPLTPEHMISGSTAQVTSVEFKQLGRTGRTRLLIQTNKLVTPNITSKQSGRTVTLTVSPAYIPGKWARPLETTYFNSSVNRIQPSQAGGRKVVFTIRLREPVPFHMGQKGLLTYVDFDPSGVPPRPVPPPRPVVQQVSAVPGQTPGVPAEGGGDMPPAPAAGSGSTMPQPDQPAAAAGQVPVASTAGGGSTDIMLGQEKQYVGEPMSMDFQNADIHNVLRLIGVVAGKNMVVSDRVSGRVTLQLTDVPWDQALEVVLTSNQLGMVESGNVIRVDTVTALLAEKDALNEEQAKERQRIMTRPLIKRVFTPRYRSADDIASEMGKLILTSGGGVEGTETATAEQRRGRVAVIGNEIYAEADEETMPDMIAIFNRLDKPTNQVLIEARIVEASSTFQRGLGIQWGGQYGQRYDGVDTGTGSPSYGWEAELGRYGRAGVYGTESALGSAVNVLPTLSLARGLDIGFSYLGQLMNLDAQIQAKEATGEARLLSAPRIMAKNDQEVHISQGQEIPYETLGQEGKKIEFKEATLLLQVTPHIENNGQVISLDVLISKKEPVLGSSGNPAIAKKEAQTKLMVKNGETVVIGGIITDKSSRAVGRVPGLHRIPLLGYLFKNDNRDESKDELLIFLTSSIIPVTL